MGVVKLKQATLNWSDGGVSLLGDAEAATALFKSLEGHCRSLRLDGTARKLTDRMGEIQQFENKAVAGQVVIFVRGPCPPRSGLCFGLEVESCYRKHANLAVGVLGRGPVGQSGGAVSPVADLGRPGLRRGGRLLGFPPRRSVLAPLWGSPAQNIHV